MLLTSAEGASHVKKIKRYWGNKCCDRGVGEAFLFAIIQVPFFRGCCLRCVSWDWFSLKGAKHIGTLNVDWQGGGTVGDEERCFSFSPQTRALASTEKTPKT